MLGRLARRWREASEARAVARRPIADDLWRRTLKRYRFLARSAEDAVELRRLCSLFLDRKEFHAMPGVRLTNDVAVAVAAQACLPVLHLGIERYDGFVGIVLQPDVVLARREHADEDGVVHVYDEVLSGEAQQGGPLMLSWRDVRQAGRHAAQGYNVVIHEFAHVLDMADGIADGVPLLPASLDRAAWCRALEDGLATLRARPQDAAEHDVAPAGLDPYACEGPEEFFAVTSEAFFVSPRALLAELPGWYAMLSSFYRQDPSAEGG